MWNQVRWAVVKRLKLWVACILFGAVYGAVYGVVCGSIQWVAWGAPFGFPLWMPAAFSGIPGAITGATGGGIMGVILLLIGKKLGPAAASVLGGLLPGLLLINLKLALPKSGLLDHDPNWYATDVIMMAIPATFAALLGIAIARAVATGRSFVPGVSRLASVVKEVQSPPQAGSQSESPAEVTPARAPTGRGDETTPSGASPGRDLPSVVLIAPASGGSDDAEGWGSVPKTWVPTRRTRSTAWLAGAALVALCFATRWIVPYFVARMAGGGRNLMGTFLAYAPLSGTRLQGATLNDANLMRANLARAQLEDANMLHANLREANLSGARLLGVQLRGADLAGANLCGADLRGLRLDATTVDPTSLQDADLRGADLRGARYDMGTYWPDGFDPQRHGALRIGPRSNLFRAQLREIDLTDANLAAANLVQADLRGSALWRAILKDTDLTGANLEAAALSGADLRGANLDGVALTGVILAGARYDARTRWPAGFDARKHSAVRVE